MDFQKKPALLAHLSDAEWLRRKAKVMYDLEVIFREEGAGDPLLVFDEENKRDEEGAAGSRRCRTCPAA